MGHQNIFMLTLILLLGASIATIAEAQSTTCASELVPCFQYINSTSPPATCCDPLRKAISTERDCLCNLYGSPGLLEGYGINRTQALALPGHCNISGDLSSCSNVTGSSPTSSPSPPAAVPGKDNNGSGRIAWTGFYGLLLFWASAMIY